MKNPWTITIVGGMIAILGAGFIKDWWSWSTLISTFSSVFNFLLSWIVVILTFKIKVLWLLLLAAFVFVGRKLWKN